MPPVTPSRIRATGQGYADTAWALGACCREGSVPDRFGDRRGDLARESLVRTPGQYAPATPRAVLDQVVDAGIAVAFRNAFASVEYVLGGGSEGRLGHLPTRLEFAAELRYLVGGAIDDQDGALRPTNGRAKQPPASWERLARRRPAIPFRDLGRVRVSRVAGAVV